MVDVVLRWLLNVTGRVPCPAETCPAVSVTRSAAGLVSGHGRHWACHLLRPWEGSHRGFACRLKEAALALPLRDRLLVAERGAHRLKGRIDFYVKQR